MSPEQGRGRRRNRAATVFARRDFYALLSGIRSPFACSSSPALIRRSSRHTVEHPRQARGSSRPRSPDRSPARKRARGSVHTARDVFTNTLIRDRSYGGFDWGSPIVYRSKSPDCGAVRITVAVRSGSERWPGLPRHHASLREICRLSSGGAIDPRLQGSPLRTASCPRLGSRHVVAGNVRSPARRSAPPQAIDAHTGAQLWT